MNSQAAHPLKQATLRPANRAGSSWMLVISIGVIVLAAIALLIAAWFAWDREAVQAWKEAASPPLFFAAMALLPALGAPLTPFYIVAGATFGVWFGLLGSAIALTVNLSICYVIARRLPRAWLHRLLDRIGYELPNFERESGALRFSLLMKFTPGVPMFLKNYVLGLSGVPFSVYLGTSLGVAALYAVPLMALGSSLFKHDWSDSWIAILLAVAVAAAAWVWRRQRD